MMTTFPDVHSEKFRSHLGSFGISGTNAHIILEEAPTLSSPSMTGGIENEKSVHTELERPNHILCISGKEEGALHDISEKYIDYLNIHQNQKDIDKSPPAMMSSRRSHDTGC